MKLYMWLQIELGYEKVAVTDLPDIPNYHTNSVNQVFIVDDFFGVLCVCLNETRADCFAKTY